MAQGRKTRLKVVVSDEERAVLESWQRSQKIPAALAKRGHLVLLLAAGRSVSDTARTVGIARRLVYKWTGRFLLERIAGLRDRPRPGRRPVFSPLGGGGSGAAGV